MMFLSGSRCLIGSSPASPDRHAVMTFFSSIRAASILPLSNRDGKGKCKTTGRTPCFLPPDHFSSSTGPQAFSRPDRRMTTPVRAGCVKTGRPGGHRRLGLDTAEHDGRLVGSGPASFSLPPSLSLHSVDATGCIVLFAVEPALAAPWSSEGFGAAMSRARLKDRRKNCAVAETRPGRDDTSLREAVNGEQSKGDHAAAFTAVQRKGSPVLHMRCRITASLRATAMVAFFLPRRRMSDPKPADRWALPTG